VLGAGLEIINNICKFAPVIADFKVADIPNTDRLICSQAFEAGASAVIVHGFPGRDSVQNASEPPGISWRYICGHGNEPSGAVEFMQPKALELASLAVECKATGVVAPATRPEKIRLIRDVVGDLTIISPVWRAGGSAADAIKAGADYVITGGAFMDQRPRIEAEKIVKEIEKCR